LLTIIGLSPTASQAKLGMPDTLVLAAAASSCSGLIDEDDAIDGSVADADASCGWPSAFWV